MSVLSVQGLEKKFKAAKVETVLKGLCLELHPGDIFCLFGANGSGKTTFLRTLLSIYPAEKGVVRFFDSPFSPSIKKRIGYLEDKAIDFPFLKVREFVDLSLKLYGFDRRERKPLIHASLERVGLLSNKEKFLNALSRGMERRLGLAELISHDPELFIMDEPLEGLDLEGMIFFQHFLTECRERKRCILLTTHLYAGVKDFATRVGVLHDGKIVEYPAQDFDFKKLSDFILSIRGGRKP